MITCDPIWLSSCPHRHLNLVLLLLGWMITNLICLNLQHSPASPRADQVPKGSFGYSCCTMHHLTTLISTVMETGSGAGNEDDGETELVSRRNRCTRTPHPKTWRSPAENRTLTHDRALTLRTIVATVENCVEEE